MRLSIMLLLSRPRNTRKEATNQNIETASRPLFLPSVGAPSQTTVNLLTWMVKRKFQLVKTNWSDKTIDFGELVQKLQILHKLS